MPTCGPSRATRTPGLVIPNHALYQLSYTRIFLEQIVDRADAQMIAHDLRERNRVVVVRLPATKINVLSIQDLPPIPIRNDHFPSEIC